MRAKMNNFSLKYQFWLAFDFWKQKTARLIDFMCSAPWERELDNQQGRSTQRDLGWPRRWLQEWISWKEFLRMYFQTSFIFVSPNLIVLFFMVYRPWCPVPIFRSVPKSRPVPPEARQMSDGGQSGGLLRTSSEYPVDIRISADRVGTHR